MSWMGKIIGSAFGLLVGGPIGAVFGASVGHQFDRGLSSMGQNHTLGNQHQQNIQAAFINASFSVMGHIAKADGVVSPAEINMAKAIMDEMQLTADQRSKAVELFQAGKKSDFQLEEVLTNFRHTCRKRQDLIHAFLRIQVQAAYADGTLENVEEQLLLHMCSRLGISRFEYQAIKMQFQTQHRFNQQQRTHRRPPPPATKRKPDLNDAYLTLGLKATASNDAVKTAYRQLISKNHPDKLIAQGLPQDKLSQANEKTQQIRKAYETICAARETKK